MSVYTVVWMIDVELEAGASAEEHVRHAAEICRRKDRDDVAGANVFHVAANGSEEVCLLRRSLELATHVDLGARSEHRLSPGADSVHEVQP